MRLTKARIFVFSVILILVSFGGGYVAGISGFIANSKNFPKVIISREVPPEKELDFSLFWRVWDTLQASYLDKSKIIESEMVYGAIKGMVAAVGDPYTVFLTPTENKVSEEDLQGNFDGVGIQIGFKGTRLAVIAPLPDSPAERAGVKPGDLILGIKDEKKDIELATTGMSLPQAVQIIRGAKGTKVTLTLFREGLSEPSVVDLIRDTIDVPSVTLEFVGESEKVAHIKVLKFGAETKQEWSTKVKEILRQPNLTGLVVDLRNNPGGYLQAAIDLASEFLPVGSTAVMEEKSNGQRTELKTESQGLLLNKKVVVLVNGGSASASEILAGALRDLKGYKVVGETSFGKGTVQEPLTLDNGSGLHITIGKWLTPKGTWINEKGIEPDIKLEDKDDTAEDEQLLEAIRLLSS